MVADFHLHTSASDGTSSSPDLLVDGDAERFTAALRVAGRLSLRFTPGRDAHGPAGFDRVYGEVPA
jgi:hypothetical protein